MYYKSGDNICQELIYVTLKKSPLSLVKQLLNAGAANVISATQFAFRDRPPISSPADVHRTKFVCRIVLPHAQPNNGLRFAFIKNVVAHLEFEERFLCLILSVVIIELADFIRSSPFLHAVRIVQVGFLIVGEIVKVVGGIYC